MTPFSGLHSMLLAADVYVPDSAPLKRSSNVWLTLCSALICVVCSWSHCTRWRISELDSWAVQWRGRNQIQGDSWQTCPLPRTSGLVQVCAACSWCHCTRQHTPDLLQACEIWLKLRNEGSCGEGAGLIAFFDFDPVLLADDVTVPDDAFLTYMAGQYNEEAEKKFKGTKGKCVQYLKLKAGNHYAITDWNPDTAAKQVSCIISPNASWCMWPLAW